MWTERIAAYRESGQGVREWCKANNLNPENMWYWLRNIRSGSEQSQVWLQAVVGSKVTPSHEPTLLVRVGKAEIEVSPGFDSELLLEAVKVLSLVC